MLASHARRALLVAFAFVAVCTGAPAAALARTETARAGSVTATFTFAATAQNTYPTKTLTITRSGKVAYDQAVTSSYCGELSNPTQQQYCVPGFAAGRSSVHAVDLEPRSEPSVVLDLYTGGAHCCSVEQVFSFDAAEGTYVMSQRNFGDPGERLVDLGHDGRFEFLTADDSFAYAFTDFAHSGLPLQILSFAGGHFRDVTRHYPKLVARDAAKYLKAFEHDLGNGEGLIAAWAADEDNLGQGKLVASTLARDLKAGELRGGTYATGQRFITALNRLLKRDGYVH
ncbi:MAG TPA: hypothetical protein VG388_01630 [Solirubrobacteraceae bacterium]|nr:hypothetical protein [Solirubrobacteraceae bacterium]